MCACVDVISNRHLLHTCRRAIAENRDTTPSFHYRTHALPFPILGTTMTPHRTMPCETVRSCCTRHFIESLRGGARIRIVCAAKRKGDGDGEAARSQNM